MEEYKLSDIAEIQTGPFGSQLHNEDYVATGTPIVTVEHLGNRRFSKQNLPLVSDDDKKRLSKYLLQEGDIVFSRVGSVDRCSYVTSTENDWLFSGRCLRVRCGNNCHPLFLFYYFCKESVKQYIKSIAVGATMPSINTKLMAEIPILLPKLDEQKRIADILSSIDDKIELNRRINDNLEQQAQALFKAWFVDNPKPNWSETTFSEVANFIGGYSYKGEELTDSSNIAMVTIKNFGRNGGFKADGFKGIAPFVKLKECHYANLFDILVAHTDLTQNADVIGNAELLLTYGRYDSIIFSMDLVKVLPKNNFPYRFLLAAMLKNKIFKGHCLGYVNGTTVLHLSKKALPNFEVKIPPKAEAKTMNDAFAPYYQRMAEVLQENDRLIHLRDTLLPKLMSGEFNINAKSRLQ
ncbi:restriction endonuclease subunit S [Bacteroides congonensis]|uniref:restriction endonuclease subunit S n=1 Tax=Bacteroides congonensis TaxID=1871006 RepID=UPI000934B4F8|nr:restriction endonuclease subunit S [Bacteroides congonensis]